MTEKNENLENLLIRKIVLCNAEEKYGPGSKALFASQTIEQGQVVLECDELTCDYAIRDTDKDMLKTKEEIINCCNTMPEYEPILMYYQIMVDQDLFMVPRLWKEKKLVCICAFFNHSCDPNCGYKGNAIISLKNINAGEEVTIDYQMFETESGFASGLKCLCGSNNCRGVLSFDQYRNVEWVAKYYDYSSSYVKSRIDDLRERWFSSQCYVKRFEPLEKGLVALKGIEPDTLVAIFSKDIKPEMHYIRPSINPNCYLVGNDVYTLYKVEPDEELTLKYSL
ncbi:uncharacterized protein LOC105850153 [Hydra vulgaris]|uniref:uncharacterized protein LOC105850153 n=1 Tax=Hydra vulgaris TaxID=6087 RepID=UPI001F5EEDC0|nr:uncharacterized protein LOC105850153 [Hydra vulgaris]XP_047144892.1 uncharacterized protein LOC105850153 [Hydra vulgaris]